MQKLTCPCGEQCNTAVVYDNVLVYKHKADIEAAIPRYIVCYACGEITPVYNQKGDNQQ
jgi:hypothetical protein